MGGGGAAGGAEALGGSEVGGGAPKQQIKVDELAAAFSRLGLTTTGERRSA